jgi:hypothetical protein
MERAIANPTLHLSKSLPTRMANFIRRNKSKDPTWNAKMVFAKELFARTAAAMRYLIKPRKNPLVTRIRSL